ncbi:deoxyribonuclease-1-like [Mugil cephalus]|uniref:deoxyribonuclease-1-like n=1 Tax=Mugil cephalus TaxID=48193 RepID=UPI001FB71711|nr:deoxyribonuclease-1-like [Mugil cephalus]
MKIAAFNVKNLGQKKVKDPTVIQPLTKIMSQYSVVVLLEVMDQSGKAMNTLLQNLNSTQRHPYSMISSDQLGRDTYKEKFVYFYRKKEVTVTNTYQYEDNQVGDEDAFAREPFVLRLSCPSTAVKDLVLIPVHTKPEDAEKELDELYDVVDAVRKRWKTKNIMILGDFNADGRYLSKKKREKIRIYSAPYHWLISDDVDTTSSNCNDNTYDRIVVYGDTMLNAVVPNSAKAFNFQRVFGLSDKDALMISDHYPVEVTLKTDSEYKKPKPRKIAVPRTTKTPSAKGASQKRVKSTGPPKKRVAAKRKRGQLSN